MCNSYECCDRIILTLQNQLWLNYHLRILESSIVNLLSITILLLFFLHNMDDYRICEQNMHYLVNFKCNKLL